MGQLEDLLVDNPSRLEQWRLEDEDQCLDSAEHLLAQACQYSVTGLGKLANDVASLPKFCSLLSEVRFAIDFAEQGASVALLPDNHFPRKQVDLHVQTKNGLELLVEVACGSPGTPRLADTLDRALKKNDLPFRVEYFLGMEFGATPGLSRPGIWTDERSSQETLISTVVDTVIKRLQQASPTDSDEIRVDSHMFRYGPSPLESGYVAGGVTGGGYIRSDEHRKKFLLDIARKAKSPATFPPRWRSVPYIVAYDAQEFSLSTNVVFEALVGSGCFLSAESPEVQRQSIATEVSQYPTVVTEKMADPDWGILLDAWGVHDRGACYFTKFGAFVSEEWAREINGILVRHPTRHKRQWLPNPWARHATISLLELGFDYVALGHDEYPF